MSDAREIDLLHDYLLGRLGDAELRVLDARLVDEPPLAQQLQRLAREEAALAAWSQSRAALKTVEAAVSARSMSWLDRASRHPRVPSLGITVTIFVALLLGLRAPSLR